MSIDKRQEKSQRKGIDWDGLIENAEARFVLTASKSRCYPVLCVFSGKARRWGTLIQQRRISALPSSSSPFLFKSFFEAFFEDYWEVQPAA